jgi:hypothetical protein
MLFFFQPQFMFRVSIYLGFFFVTKTFFSSFWSLQFSLGHAFATSNNKKRKQKMADTSMDYSEYSENENSPMVAPKVNIASTLDAHRSSFSFVNYYYYYYYYCFGLSYRIARARKRERERFSLGFFLPPQQKKKDLRARRMNCVHETLFRIPSRMR